MHQANGGVSVPTSAVERDDQDGHAGCRWEIPCATEGVLREGDSIASKGVTAGGDE